jgi:hypothetical protein
MDESRRAELSVRFGGSRPRSWRAEDIQLAEVSAERDRGIEGGVRSKSAKR